jgi:phosphoribosylaminoimidazole (AIR) synthetase
MWEIEADSMEEACRRFHRLRYKNGGYGEVVDTKIHSAMLVEVTDEAGTKYDIAQAENVIAQVEDEAEEIGT